MIVQYGGQEKLEELRAKVQTMKSQSTKKAKFSEQEIGKDTVNNTPTESKDKAKDRVKQDEQLIIQEGQKNYTELE